MSLTLPSIVIAALLGSGPAAPQGVSAFAGTYVSSMFGGCTLRLSKTGGVVLKCSGQPAQTGSSVARETDFVVLIPKPPEPPNDALGVPRGEIAFPPANAPDDLLWLPLIDSGSGGNAIALKPVRWGARLYLVADLTRFCDAIKKEVEPRVVSVGTEFLRAGDERKAAGRTLPTPCLDKAQESDHRPPNDEMQLTRSATVNGRCGPCS